MLNIIEKWRVLRLFKNGFSYKRFRVGWVSKVFGDTETIKNISEDNHDLSEKIKNSTKPLIIFGQSSLLLKSFGFIFESLKTFLVKNNKITDEWNSLNIMSNDASTVGSIDLGIYKNSNNENEVLKNLQNNIYEIVYLIGNIVVYF